MPMRTFRRLEQRQEVVVPEAATPEERVVGLDRAHYAAATLTLADDVPVTVVGPRATVATLAAQQRPAAPAPLLLSVYGAYGNSSMHSDTNLRTRAYTCIHTST
jgi:protease II